MNNLIKSEFNIEGLEIEIISYKENKRKQHDLTGVKIPI